MINFHIGRTMTCVYRKALRLQTIPYRRLGVADADTTTSEKVEYVGRLCKSLEDIIDDLPSV